MRKHNRGKETNNSLKVALPRLILGTAMVFAWLAASLVHMPLASAAVLCNANNPVSAPYGQVTSTFNVTTAGTYKVWSRIKVPSTTNNSYSLQINHLGATNAFTCNDFTGTPGTNVSIGSWIWSPSTTATPDLGTGSHQAVMSGTEQGVELDKILLVADTTCVPTDAAGNPCLSSTSGDTVNPTVSMTSPANGGSATVGTTVNLAATASDNVGVTKVEFYDGGTLLSTDTASPYSYSWNTANANTGSHTLTAKASDAAGNVATSNAVSFTLNPSGGGGGGGSTTTINDTAAGTGLNQFNYSANTGWVGQATCPTCLNSDDHVTTTAGATYQVQFSGTQIKIYSQTGPGAGIGAISIDGGTEKMVDAYSASQTNQVLTYTSPVLADGTHTLKVRNTGNKNASSKSTYLVADRVDITSGGSSTGDTVSPTVSLTAPANGTTYTLSCTAGAATSVPVSMAATASDNVGVTKVEFYYDGNLLSTDTSAPYAASTAATAGTHTITAKAWDAANNNTTANAVTITVQPCQQTGIPGDIDGDGHVNAIDEGILITHDGENYAPADLNQDGTINGADAAILLAHWTW